MRRIALALLLWPLPFACRDFAQTTSAPAPEAEAGADASHRGGRPGFVRVEAADRLSFADYPGNAMFNTLGNLVAWPRLALLFVDFESGDLLEVGGRATVGPQQTVEVRVEEVREAAGSLPLRYELVEYSPAIPEPSRSPLGGI